MGGHGDIVAVPGLHDRAVDDIHLGAAARLQVGVDAGEAVRRLLQVQPDAGDLLLGVERVTVGGGGGAQLTDELLDQRPGVGVLLDVAWATCKMPDSTLEDALIISLSQIMPCTWLQTSQGKPQPANISASGAKRLLSPVTVPKNVCPGRCDRRWSRPTYNCPAGWCR